MISVVAGQIKTSSALDRTVISTWIVLDSPEEETAYPSAGTHSSSKKFQRIYWRCITVFFATSIKQNPNAHHVLFCSRPFDQIEEPEIIALLRKWNVELIHFPLTYRLPKGAVSTFGNVFYELDILKYAVQQDWAKLLVLDNDCVWVKPVTPFLEMLDEHPIVGYALRPEDQKNYQGEEILLNGMSRKRLRAAIEELSGKPFSTEVRFYGGEIFGLTKQGTEALVADFDWLWDRTVRESNVVDSIKTEEHFLTILFEKNGAPPYACNPYIRRLWTHFADFNVRASDLDLSVWHVPAEKNFGFKTLFDEIYRTPERFFAMSNEEAVMLIRRHMGIPKRSSFKYIRDVSLKVIQKLRAKVASAPPKLAPSPQQPVSSS